MNESIDVVMVKRVKGGWDRKSAHVKLAPEEVGKLIRVKWGKSIEQVYKDTKVGEWIMTHFYGTLTQIAECYKLAGDDVYQEWLNKTK